MTGLNARQQPPFSFSILLFFLVLLLLTPGMLSPDQTGYFIRLVFATTLFAGLYLVANKPRQLWIGLILVIPVLFTNWSFGVIPDQSRIVVNNLSQIIFLTYICGHILLHLVHARRITTDLILAALCLYLVIGLMFGFGFVALELLMPGSIKLTADYVVTDLNSYRQLQAELIYFSYVTLSTLGYGDILPNLPLARSICTLEALTGQVYLAVIIARIVGLHISAPGDTEDLDD
jgi:hypothetical protein